MIRAMAPKPLPEASAKRAQVIAQLQRNRDDRELLAVQLEAARAELRRLLLEARGSHLTAGEMSSLAGLSEGRIAQLLQQERYARSSKQ